MKHLTYGEKTLLLDDATADAVVEYAVLLSDAHRSDAVTVHALGVQGERVTATLLLSASVPLFAEHVDAPEFRLADDAQLADLRARSTRLSDPPVRPGADPRPPRDDATESC